MFRFRSNPRKGRTTVPAHNAIVTSGFDENEGHTVHLHYTERLQPDLGGALNFSYDLYALPLKNLTGGFMAARGGFRTTTPPTAFFQQAPVTSLGGTVSGSFAFQPLLDPTNPAGFDINDI